MKQKIYNFMYRLMYGRYGSDRLNRWLLVATIICFVLYFLFKIWIIEIIGYILWFISLFRMFSKNIYKRRMENDKFNNFLKGFDRQKALFKKRREDKYNAYFRCPSCKQMVRIPKGRGKVVITCPKCHTKFSKRT